MPVIALFYGIKILIFFDDHNPPHFHAQFAEHEAWFRIDDGEIPGLSAACASGDGSSLGKAAPG